VTGLFLEFQGGELLRYVPRSVASVIVGYTTPCVVRSSLKIRFPLTKMEPMGVSESIKIFASAVDSQIASAAHKVFRLVFSEGNNIEFTIKFDHWRQTKFFRREDAYEVVRMPGVDVVERNRVSAFQDQNNIFGFDLLPWSFASVLHANLANNRISLLDSVREFTFNIEPCAFIHPEIIMTIAPLEKGYSSVNTSGNESSPSRFPYPVLYAVLSICFGLSLSYYLFCVTDRYINTYLLVPLLMLSFASLAYGVYVLLNILGARA